MIFWLGRLLGRGPGTTSPAGGDRRPTDEVSAGRRSKAEQPEAGEIEPFDHAPSDPGPAEADAGGSGDG